MKEGTTVGVFKVEAPDIIAQKPERMTCRCGEVANYAGTQDSVRVYVCGAGHLTQVRP